jgi:hypothetical protein
MKEASAEMRWFGTGEPPEALDAAFGHPTLANEERRRDLYLRLPPASDTVGIKFRRGKVEVKAMTAAARDVALLGGLVGRLEVWVKWSLDLTAVEGSLGLEAAFRNSGPVAAVTKVRRMRKFERPRGRPTAPTGAHVLRAVNPEARVARGCNVELTRLGGDSEVCDPHRWTFGFEAYGLDLADASVILTETAALVLSEAAPAIEALRLAAAPMSYPAWLAAWPAGSDAVN